MANEHQGEATVRRQKELEPRSNRPSQSPSTPLSGSEPNGVSLTISILGEGSRRIKAHLTVEGNPVAIAERQSLACAYAALALKRTSTTPDAVVQARELHAMKPWRATKIHNVAVTFGSRHVGLTLPRLGLGDLIRCEGLTQAWALTLPPERISFEPSRAQVQAWCDGLGHSDATELGEAIDWTWLNHALRGTLAAEAGALRSDADNADTHIAQMRELAPGNGLAALVAGFIDVRAQSQRGPAPLDKAIAALRHDANRLRKDGHAVADAAGRRALAIQHFHDRTLRELLPRSVDELEHAIANARQSGDVGALAQLQDTLGLVLMRLDPINESARNRARDALREAMILQMLDGDRVRLQATLRHAVLLEALPTLYWREPASDELLQLHQLSFDVCTAFGNLAPSAQSPCLGILLHSSRGKFDHAFQWIRRANRAMENMDHPLEQGFRNLAEGHFWWARSESSSGDSHGNCRNQASACLKQAREHYRRFGDNLFERLIAVQLQALARRQAIDRNAVAALVGKDRSRMI